MRSTIRLFKQMPVQRRVSRPLSRALSSSAWQSTSLKRVKTKTGLALAIASGTGTAFLLWHLNNRKFDKTSHPPRISTIDFNSVIGNEEIIEDLAGMISFLKKPKWFDPHSAKMPHAVLLSGEHGVGKTMMAEALAGHAGVKLISIHAADLQDSDVSFAEENVKKLFDDAKVAAPCVLLIDKIDTLMNDDSIIRCLFAALSHENKGVLIVAATHDPYSLTPISCWGFGKHMHIPLPDRYTRIEMLKVYTQDIVLADGVSFTSLAEMTAGYSGAKIFALVREAANIGLREDVPAVTLKHVEQAMKTMNLDVLPLNNRIELELRVTALHEAGHAVVAHSLKTKVKLINVIPRGMNLGVTWCLYPKAEMGKTTRQDVLNNICVLLAGVAAELMANNVAFGGEDDIEEACHLARMLAGFSSVKNDRSTTHLAYEMAEERHINWILEEELSRAKSIIRDHKKEWELMTDTLVEQREISGLQLQMLLNGENLHASQALEYKRNVREQLPVSMLHNVDLINKEKPTFTVRPLSLLSTLFTRLPTPLLEDTFFEKKQLQAPRQ